jgi:hypothetical protein
MIRNALEKKVGLITNEEWSRVCRIANADIKVNRLLHKQKTSHQYLGMVLVTAINIIRD